jgi:hypothetical protein
MQLPLLVTFALLSSFVANALPTPKAHDLKARNPEFKPKPKPSNFKPKPSNNFKPSRNFKLQIPPS